ncbi:RNase Sy, partial [Linderina pennispora]
DMCPQNVLSCSTEALAKKADTCCYEQYGVHVLTQQWNKDVGPADMFTLHGLWPSACKGKSPPTFGCDNSRKKRKVKSILQAAKPELVADMLIYWPASDNKHDEFWGKEWTRHGTCATTLDPKCFKSYTQNEDIVEYFSNAIKLHKAHNYIPALASKGIVPDDTALVDPKDFKDAIKTKLNIDVEISCTQSADGTEEILNEVRTYFNVKLTSDYTLTAAKGRNSCTKPFKFPKK